MKNWCKSSIVGNHAILLGIQSAHTFHIFHLLSHVIKVHQAHLVLYSIELIEGLLRYTVEFADGGSRILEFSTISVRAESHVLYKYLN